MLEKIRLPNFFKKLFSFVTEKVKLNLLKYSKSLQKVLELSLDIYKEVAGKYVIYGSDNTAKEYWISTEKLIYEGGYLNRKRNGKGKEYYHNGKLKYEGEYLNRHKWNGKLYDYNNNIEYKIENGKGEIKEYNFYGELIYEGGYLYEKKMEKVKNIITMIN